MGLTKIRITDPIGWFEKCVWIYNNCNDCHDVTNWHSWQIGMDDIEFIVYEKDAILYYLRWS